jgi:hypothetical protein
MDAEDFASLLRRQLSEATLAACSRRTSQQQAGQMRDKIVNLAIKAAAFTILL